MNVFMKRSARSLASFARVPKISPGLFKGVKIGRLAPKRVDSAPVALPSG